MATTKTSKEKMKTTRRPGLAFPVTSVVFCLAVTCLANDLKPRDDEKVPLSFDVHEEQTFVVDPGRTDALSGLPIRVFGLQPGDFRFYVGTVPAEGQVTAKEIGSPIDVELRFFHDLPPGEHDIRLEQGEHVHIRRSAIYVTHRPRLQSTLCGEREVTLELTAGQRVEVSVTPGTGSKLRAFLGEAPLHVDIKEAGKVLFVVPSGLPVEVRLKLVEEAGRFGRILLCEHRVRILEDRFRVEGVELRYDPSAQRIRARLRGAKLPDAFTATVAGSDRSVHFRAAGGEEPERLYDSDPVSQSFEQLTSFELTAESGGFHKTRGRWIVSDPDLWTWKKFESQLEHDLYRIFEEGGSGEVQLGGKAFTLARIDAQQAYSIGLSEPESQNPALAQLNLAGPSSHPSGIVSLGLRKAFLMSVYEVTKAQFSAYLERGGEPGGRERELAPGLEKLPVTQVSFVDVRRYVEWLQGELAKETSKWQVRLPHELEWEMAARGSQALDYAFRGHDRETGLASLEKAGPRPVGANPVDRSPFGILDMTGNVREWTSTVYSEQMLEYLAVYMNDTLADGWDPTHLVSLPGIFEELPRDLAETSRKMTLRGGANGEHPVLQLLSVRRQMELAEAAEDVGFRVVLVPRGEL